MKTKVYCETSLISWLVSRPSTVPASVVRQAYTRKWWEERAGECDFYVSGVVVREAADGDKEQANLRIAEIAKMKLLDGERDGVRRVAEALIRYHAVPETEATDAFHIVTAAVYGMDVLLAWNSKHMANLVAIPKTASVIARAGYECPKILTPKDALEV